MCYTARAAACCDKPWLYADVKRLSMSDLSAEIEDLVVGPRDRSLLLGLLLGALAGAAAATLLAPRSGPATRELLRERGLELKDRADDLLRGRRQSSPL